MTVVKIMIDESLPSGSVKVVPRICVTSVNDVDELLDVLTQEHKIAYCPSIEAGEKVRAVIAATDGLLELP